MKHERKKINTKLVWTLLIALSLLSITGCNDPDLQIEEFPEDYYYKVSVSDQTCVQYKIVDKEKFQFVFDKEISMDSCPDVFGFTQRQTPFVLDWMEAMVKQVRNLVDRIRNGAGN